MYLKYLKVKVIIAKEMPIIPFYGLSWSLKGRLAMYVTLKQIMCFHEHQFILMRTRILSYELHANHTLSEGKRDVPNIVREYICKYFERTDIEN